MSLKIFIVLLIFIFIPFGSAFHFIYGQVGNALDGENANGHLVVVWNSAQGISDNLTDVIGPTGGSYTDNTYMVDCDLLTNGCSIGEILSVKVINSGDDYISSVRNVTVTGAGFDEVSNIILNSIPTAFLHFPLPSSLNGPRIEFNCSFKDWDVPSGNLTLFGNWSGQWQEEAFEDVSVDNISFLFPEVLTEGTYVYGCKATDNLSMSSFSENITFHVDATAPNINYFISNESFFCGDVYINLICNVDDNWNLSEVLIEVSSPSSAINYSTTNNSGNYSLDLNVNENGNWNFTCYATDGVGNVNSSLMEIISYSGLPDVFIQNISFSSDAPFEGEDVLINATIGNSACVNTGVFSVGFYVEDPFDLGVLIEVEQTLSLSNFSVGYVNVNYVSPIGNSNIFVYVDNGSVLTETNETNNIDNKSLYVSYWQDFYGNLTVTKILNFQLESFNNWSLESFFEANVFMADSESDISWSSLKAIGKLADDSDSSDDFSDLDILLNMTDTRDSFSTTYANLEVPKNPVDFLVHKNYVYDVPTINSTDSGNFITGILWDTSDDSDGEFDVIEKEDLVFVAKVNKSTQGKYGFYDYEIKVPAMLREYDETNIQDLYFYFELN